MSWRGWLWVVFAASIVSCQARQNAPARQVTRAQSPYEVVIDGDIITYKGKALQPRATVNDWLGALGPPTRDITPGDRFLIWDDLGTYVRIRDEKASEVGIYFQPRNPPADPRHFSFLPRKPFAGKLTVDGGVIQKDILDPTTIEKRPPPWRAAYKPRLYTFRGGGSPSTIVVTLETNIGGGAFLLILDYLEWVDPKRSGTR